MKISRQKSGFAMLYASLIGGLVLVIGLAILNVTVKQITLASAARESQQAFYRANAGIECGLLLKSTYDYFASHFGDSGYTCFGQSLDTDGPVSGGSGEEIYEFSVNDGNNICFDAEYIFYDKGDGDTCYSVVSNGFNKCNTGVANRFERTLKTSTCD